MSDRLFTTPLLSIKDKREILKRISKGIVKPEEDFPTGQQLVEMWAEDESDAQCLRMFFPDTNKRIKKVDFERRVILSNAMHVTLDIT